MPKRVAWHRLSIAALVALCLLPALSRAGSGVSDSPPTSAGTRPKRIVSDTLNVIFELNKVDIKPHLYGNSAQIERFVSNVRQMFADVPADSLKLDIYAGASPEGSLKWNTWLGEHRGLALEEVLRQRLGSFIGHYVIHNERARWDAFYRSIEQSREPWRDEVMQIVRDVPQDQDTTQRDAREWRLRRLHGGTVWRRLLDVYLPPLRSSGSAIVSIIQPGDPILGKPEQPQPRPVAVVPAQPVAPRPAAPRPDGPPVPVTPQAPPAPQGPFDHPAWAVKTNLLLWGVVAPNVQVELPIGTRNRWSIEAEYVHPWWVWAHNARAEQDMSFGLELRLWLGNRRLHRWLDGHHVGLAVHGGYYDLEWKRHKGYQGEAIMGYVNYGWQHRFSDHWAVDMGVGVGALFTKYRHYYGESRYGHSWDEHLIWNNNGRWYWVGPVHANLSVVYTFNMKRKIKMTPTGYEF